MDKYQIKDYIEKYKNQYSRESITSQLKNSGASQEDINSVFNQIEGNTISPPTMDGKFEISFFGFIKNSLGLYFGNRDKSFEYIKHVGFGKAFLYYWLITMFIIGLTYLSNSLVLGLVSVPILFISIILGSLLGLILFAGICLGIFHLLLMMFGGSANYEDTVKFSFSVYILPGIVNTLINILLILTLGMLSTTYSIISIIIGVIFFVLIYYVMVLVQSKLHRISKLIVFKYMNNRIF